MKRMNNYKVEMLLGAENKNFEDINKLLFDFMRENGISISQLNIEKKGITHVL